jgi:hypothetical protein
MNAASKAATAAASTGSAPFSAVSSDASDNPWRSSTVTCRTACANAKFGASVIVAPNAPMARSHVPGSFMNALGGRNSTGVRLYRPVSAAPMSPMSWWSGSQLTHDDPGPAIASAMIRALATMLAWLSATPMGRLVLPDVYCRSARSEAAGS